MRTFRTCILLIILLPCSARAVWTGEPIRVGVLYSSTGTMAISETRLKDALMALIDEQNEQGGLLGRRLEGVVMDPASNWLLYAEKARQLIEREEVAAIFGCWTSASRKAVKPVVEEFGALLFYPVQYEGREQSENIFYLGATPNQQALPAVHYLQDNLNIQRWVLAGTDYVYPRTTNRMLSSYLRQRGVPADDIMLSYTPFGHKDWKRIVSEIGKFGSEGKRTAVISTLNGGTNVAFYSELAEQGISATDIPVLAFSVGEGELTVMDSGAMVGHLAAWNYFMSIDSSENRAFIANLRRRSGGEVQVVSDPIEAQYIGFQLWLKAVAAAGSTDTDEVRKAMIGLSGENLSGGRAEMLPNHHISKPAYIGRLRRDGQYEIIWKSAEDIPGDPWFDPSSAKADKGQ